MAAVRCPHCKQRQTEKHCLTKGCTWTTCGACGWVCRKDGNGYSRSRSPE